jgi:uncharacterized protein YuzE
MESITILESAEELTMSYDKEADVVYFSFGQPKPAVGFDAGEGMIVRYDDDTNTIVGLTIIGLRTRLMRELVGSEEE